MFEQPPQPQPGQFKLADHNGQLILLTVHGVQGGITTRYGEQEAIRADVVVLDAPNGPDETPQALIFGGIVNSLRLAVGKQVLGRIGQGVGKNGQSPPWVLQPFTDADAALATAYITSRKQQQFTQPQTEPATPAPAPPAATPPEQSPEVLALLAQIQAKQGQPQPAQPPY